MSFYIVILFGWQLEQKSMFNWSCLKKNVNDSLVQV